MVENSKFRNIPQTNLFIWMIKQDFTRGKVKGSEQIWKDVKQKTRIKYDFNYISPFLLFWRPEPDQQDIRRTNLIRLPRCCQHGRLRVDNGCSTHTHLFSLLCRFFFRGTYSRKKITHNTECLRKVILLRNIKRFLPSGLLSAPSAAPPMWFVFYFRALRNWGKTGKNSTCGW